MSINYVEIIYKNMETKHFNSVFTYNKSSVIMEEYEFYRDSKEW